MPNLLRSLVADSAISAAFVPIYTQLQEQGRKQEAKEVFRRCVDTAKKGPIHECRVFAR